MAVAIALNKPDHSANSAARTMEPATRATPPCSPRSNAAFAATLAKTQAQASRRAAASPTSPAASGKSNEPKPEEASPSVSARAGGTPRAAAAPQRPETPPALPAGASAKTQNGSTDKRAGGPAATNAAGTSSAAHDLAVNATTAPENSAGSVNSLPPTPSQPAAAPPNPTLNAIADLSDGTADPSVSEPAADVAATGIPPLEASPVPPDDADPFADVAPAGSSATSSSKPATQAAPAASGQDPNTADGALLLHATPTDAAAPSPSEQAVPQSAHTPPGASQWAEARETVAMRVDHAVQDGVQNVSIDLHPPELGHVGIELSFHAGGVSVQMTLSRQDTYEAFSRDRSALEQQLAQTGINLGGGGLDLRFDQKRDQPPAASGSSFSTRIQAVQPATAADPSARPRATRGLLNIIA
jgi:flagellar hook-length control protein FliK